MYEIKKASIKRVRWMGERDLKVRYYTTYFSRTEKRNQFGYVFAVHETVELYIKEFNSISEKLAVIRIDTKLINI